MIYFSILYNMFYRICWTVHSMHIVIVFLFDVKEIAVMILLIRVQVASTADYKLDSPHALELFLVGHEVFLHLIGYVISPACPGSALGSFSSWTCMKFFLLSTRHLKGFILIYITFYKIRFQDTWTSSVGPMTHYQFTGKTTSISWHIALRLWRANSCCFTLGSSECRPNHII